MRPWFGLTHWPPSSMKAESSRCAASVRPRAALGLEHEHLEAIAIEQASGEQP
jgi:hypothetical protein